MCKQCTQSHSAHTGSALSAIYLPVPSVHSSTTGMYFIAFTTEVKSPLLVFVQTERAIKVLLFPFVRTVLPPSFPPSAAECTVAALSVHCVTYD